MEHQPALSNHLHPGADVGEKSANPEAAIVCMRESTKHSSLVTNGNGRRFYVNGHAALFLPLRWEKLNEVLAPRMHSEEFPAKAQSAKRKEAPDTNTKKCQRIHCLHLLCTFAGNLFSLRADQARFVQQ